MFILFFFLPDRPTHLHEREGDGERNILWGWPNQQQRRRDIENRHGRATSYPEASREDSGYEDGIIGESRACSGGKWITFRKEHREKHPGDEVNPFNNIFDIKGILVRIPFIDKWYPLPYLQSWTKALEHFGVSGVFSNSHRPNPSPHPTNKDGRVYPQFFPSFNFV